MSEDNPEIPVDPALNPGDPPPADPAPQPEPAPEPPPRMVPVETLVREVTPLRAKNRELEQVVDEHRRQLREAQELIGRLQRDPADPGAAPPQRQTDQAQFTQADVERAAFELNFKRDADTISQTAYKTYGQDWVNSLGILNSFQLNGADFVGSVMDVVGVGKTHEVMHEIAQNPETAASLAQMSPARRIAEITRISERMNGKPGGGTQTQVAPAAQQPPARTVSRAPAPAPRVEPAASKVLSWDTDQDKMSDDEWSRTWNDRMSKRTVRR